MCEYMKKVLEKVKARYGDQIEVRQLYYDPDAKLYRQYKVVFVPTQFFWMPLAKKFFAIPAFLPSMRWLRNCWS